MSPHRKSDTSSLAPTPAGVKAGPGGQGEGLAARLVGDPPGPGPLLVGVSGGGDSVALLRLLAGLAPARGWVVTAAHVDHGLRPDSDQDRRFVGELAAALGVGFAWRRVAVGGPGLSPEEAAREARRAALGEMAQAAGAKVVALAHTADDQAETLVFRLFSGTGPSGLAGMRPWAGLFWRPLLAVGRSELRDWLRELGQAWREDPSNQGDQAVRNRVRQRLLPLAREEVNPRSVEALCRLAEICADEESFWQAWCADWARTHGRREGTSLWLAMAGLADLDRARRRRLLRWAALATLGAGQGLALAHLDRLADLAAGPPGRSLGLPGGLWAWREAAGLRLDTSRRPQAFYATLAGPGEVEIPFLGKRLKAELADPPERPRARGERVWLPAAAVSWPLRVRLPRRGERFQALGAPGSKRLSRFMIDLKVPTWWRARTLMVEDAGGVWWAAPWSLAERARWEPAQGEGLMLSLEGMDLSPR